MNTPTIEELKAMTEEQALEATAKLDEHPWEYSGPCACVDCQSYADEPAAED